MEVRAVRASPGPEINSGEWRSIERDGAVPYHSSAIKRSRRAVITAGTFNLHDNAAIRPSTCTFRFGPVRFDRVEKVSRDDAGLALREIDS